MTLVVVLVAFRFDLIDTRSLFVLAPATWAFGLLAMILALLAFLKIWKDGLLGIGNAVRGFLFALVTLGIPIAGLVVGVQFPPLNDISTDLDDPPFFRTAPATRTQLMNVHGAISAEAAAKQHEAYPDIATRRFDVDTAHLFAAVRYVVKANEWDVIDEIAPVDVRGPARIEAVARTFLLGFRDDIVIRLLPDDVGSRLDIRSASRYGQHDFGANAKRIRAFLAAVDRALIVAPLDYDPAGV